MELVEYGSMKIMPTMNLSTHCATKPKCIEDWLNYFMIWEATIQIFCCSYAG